MKRILPLMLFVCCGAIVRADLPFFLDQPSGFREFTDFDNGKRLLPNEVVYRFALTPLENTRWNLFVLVQFQNLAGKRCGRLMYLLSTNEDKSSVTEVDLSASMVEALEDILDETEIFALPEGQTRRNILVHGLMVCGQEMTAEGVRVVVRCDGSSLPMREFVTYLRKTHIPILPKE